LDPAIAGGLVDFRLFTRKGRSIGIERISQASVVYDQEDRQMKDSRTRDRRATSRAFRPALDGRLEERFLLTRTQPLIKVAHGLLKHTQPRAAFNVNQPPFLAGDAPYFHRSRQFKKIRAIGTQTARGGQNVEVTATDGSHYMITLSYTSNTLATNIAEGSNGQQGNSTPTSAAQLVTQQSARYPQPIGVVRAYPMAGGRVGIIVDGSTLNTELAINPLGQPQRKGFAHSYAYGEANRAHVLNVGQITINSGQIGGILGFQSANLSGPLVSLGTGAIDRIAFENLLPGASINVGGDVNTLDVLGNASLSGGGTGVFIGRDLNLLNVGGTLTLSGGAQFSIGRFLGLVNQPPKGTGTGTNVLLLNFNTLQNTITSVSTPSAIGTYIQGSVVINPGSEFLVGANIVNPMYVEGSISGATLLRVNANAPPGVSPTFLTALPPSPFIVDNLVVALGGSTP
jgi:hypothetical protein